jgi:hypothetical protein
VNAKATLIERDNMRYILPNRCDSYGPWPPRH